VSHAPAAAIHGPPQPLACPAIWRPAARDGRADVHDHDVQAA
jgi:hypothetical protein